MSFLKREQIYISNNPDNWCRYRLTAARSSQHVSDVRRTLHYIKYCIPSKKKEQKFCGNSTVHFSIEFPHCVWRQKSEKGVNILGKFCRKMDSRISAIFFTSDWLYWYFISLMAFHGIHLIWSLIKIQY